MCARLEQQSKSWLEPLQNLLKDAENIGEIATSPSLAPKKSAALKIFGSNLFLKNQKLEYTPQTQWAALSAAIQNKEKVPLSCFLVPLIGVEPIWL